MEKLPIKTKIAAWWIGRKKIKKFLENRQLIFRNKI
jgi:hypothetical protein